MKQVEQNYRSGALRVVDVPVPRVGEGSMLVGTNVSLISSGTEKQAMELARASLAGKALARPDLVRRVIGSVRKDGLRPTVEKVLAKLDTPIPLGYSLAGVVMEVGRRVSGISVGDRVACAGAGLANHAEFNAMPKNLTVRIPEAVDDEDASFVTLGAIALQGVRLAAPTLGERIVVLGLGLIGLLTVQLLRANGCRVLGYDPNVARVALARDLGADAAVFDDVTEAVRGFTGGVGADAVIITAATKSSEPVNLAAEVSRSKGRIVVVGLVGLTIDREPFYKRELELRLSMSYGPGRGDPDYEQDGRDYPLPYVRWTEQRNMEAFLSLVAEGKVTPKRLVTHRFPIAEAERAYELMDSGAPHLAILLSYPEPTTNRLDKVVTRAPRSVEGTRNRVGFIGFGNYAKGVLLPALRKAPGVELAAVATSTGISAGHASDKHGFAAIATDPSALIADPGVDTIFIVTRHDSHAGLTAAALRGGKHVFCEKPLALDMEALDEAISAAREGPGVLTVGFNRRFAPLLIQAKVALEPRTGPLVMLYRINAGRVPGDSWVHREEGGGRILGEVCHFVDALTALAGSLPVEVQAMAARDHSDTASILIRFAEGSTGAIVYTSLGDPGVSKEYIEIFAAGRVIQIDDFQALSITRGGKTKRSRSTQDKGQQALVAAFLRATRGETEAPIPIDEIFAVSAATIGIEEAIRRGGSASVPERSR